MALFDSQQMVFGSSIGLLQNMFHNLLIYTNNFCFGYITVSCFFQTFPGWLGGWLGVVGKSDFNENPGVSLDLDLDFGLRLRVCQLQDVFLIVIKNLDTSNLKKKAKQRKKNKLGLSWAKLSLSWGLGRMIHT